MTPSEASIVRAIFRAILKEKETWVTKLHGSVYQSGLPDLVGCRRGRFFAFEVKRPGQKPTRLQRLTLLSISSSGALAAVVHSPEEAISLLRSLDSK